VDIHGAPGSQNGYVLRFISLTNEISNISSFLHSYDNSGQRTNSPTWANGDNPARTIDYVRYLVKQAGGLIDVLELLNEGAGFRGDDWASAVRKYFSNGYDVVRTEVGTDMVVMIGDGFLGVSVKLTHCTVFSTCSNLHLLVMEWVSKRA
jgi:glucan 1,3-beta-glucosidase